MAAPFSSEKNALPPLSGARPFIVELNTPADSAWITKPHNPGSIFTLGSIPIFDRVK